MHTKRFNTFFLKWVQSHVGAILRLPDKLFNLIKSNDTPRQIKRIALGMRLYFSNSIENQTFIFMLFICKDLEA